MGQNLFPKKNGVHLFTLDLLYVVGFDKIWFLHADNSPTRTLGRHVMLNSDVLSSLRGTIDQDAYNNSPDS